MKPSELFEVLPGLMERRTDNYLPVFLWGPPGLGKSSIIHQVAGKTGRELVDVRAVLLDPVDLRGIPHINGDGRAHWCPPDFLPSDPKSDAIIFLDELAQAAPLVQSACLQLTLDRKIGEYKLPDGCTIVAASNRQEDRAGAHRLISPLLNRFVHVDVEVSNDDWHAWALDNDIDPRITAFIRFKPDTLFAFDPKSADNSFPTPRSWEFASHAIERTPVKHMFAMVKGCVGTGAAAEFCSFAELCTKLPDIDKVLANPLTADIPEGEPSVLYALCGALAAKLKSDPSGLAENYAAYVSRFRPEYGVLAIRDGMAITPTLCRTKAGEKWLAKNNDLILSASEK